MKDLVKVIQEESYTYRDPITSFIEDLYVKFDFDGAQQKLRDCESVLVNDFFLVACLEEFIENSRLMIFETFCRYSQSGETSFAVGSPYSLTILCKGVSLLESKQKSASTKTQNP